MSQQATPDVDRSLQYFLDRLVDGPGDRETTSEAVRQSWRRSVDAGLLPQAIRPPFDPDIDVESRLHWAVAPIARVVSEDLADTHVAILLTDDRGHVIDRWSSKHTAAEMDHIGAAAGFVCGESVVGTNSIGMAIVTGGPAQVLGLEHFADGLSQLWCAARAVTDPLTGQLVGVVNMTCGAKDYSAVIPALISRIVHEVEQRMLADSGASATALHAALLQARRRAKGPIAALNQQCMFVNSAGASKIQDADRAVLWHWAQSLLGTKPPGGVPAITLPSGRYDARCEPVYEGKSVVGALVWLDAISPSTSGLGTQAASVAGWATLTASERSVADHVANGLTNRETASLLYISTHTVDYHLRQIFRKLDLHLRVELARVVANVHNRTGISSR